MDITLERILSLIPRKENGKFVHGEVKAFADRIGLRHPQIVSDWIGDRNKSYTKYLYQISDKYNVSVEWLKGETDIKEKPAPTNGDGILEKYNALSPESQALVRNLIEQLAKNQSAH